MRKSACLALLVTALFSAPRNDRWNVIGPGGGGAQYFPTISPHDPNHVLVACDMTGSYLTEDGGAHWRMFNLGGTTRSFAWDPKDRNVIYANNTGLYRSSDAGRSWKLIYPQPARVTGVDLSDDHADETILADGQPSPRLGAFAIDSKDSRILYAGLGAALLISPDSGQTWRKDHEFSAPIRRIWSTANTLLVSSDRSVFRRDQQIWSEGAALTAPWVDIAAGSPVIYAVAESVGKVSTDSGTTWREFALPGTGARLKAVATSEHHSEVAYVSYDNLKLDDQVWYGVAKTTDAGKTWQLVWKENAKAAANVHDGWITGRFGPTWGEHPLTLGVSPNDPNLCYATDLGRTMRTVNGGQTWEAVYTRKTPAGWTSTGLDVTTTYGVHFDPFDPKRLFITYTDIGAFRSEDGGASWLSATEGVPARWVNTTYWMAFDPEVRGRVWAVASGTHDLPRPKMWRRTPTERFRGGVIVSEDGGRTWSKSSNGMPETAATHILLDPKSPKSARTLYVAAFGRGVYKSVDGGKSWLLTNQGIDSKEPFAWRLTQVSGGGLYLVIARRSEDGNFGNSGDGAVYYSADGAEHWTRVDLPNGVNGPNAITVDSGDPKRLYLSAWQRKGAGSGGSGGIFLSTDAGKKWRSVLSKDQHVYDVTADARDPRILYACGFESSAWRSIDRGETWQRIRGYNFKWGHRVIPDPADPKRIYVTTFGGSVWHGPAEGDPQAVEDTARPYSAIR